MRKMRVRGKHTSSVTVNRFEKRSALFYKLFFPPYSDKKQKYKYGKRTFPNLNVFCNEFSLSNITENDPESHNF